MLHGNPAYQPAHRTGHNRSQQDNQADDFLMLEVGFLTGLGQHRHRLDEDQRQHQRQQGFHPG
ncbi:hypothetical protein D3C76_1869180 [compost metagenome]